MGRNGSLGGVTKRFCLIYSPDRPSSNHVWGGTWEGGERNADFAGETRISLERAWGLGGLGLLDIILCARHPCVGSCVVSKCELPHSTIGGKRWGEAMQGRGVRGRDDLLSQQTLSELQETKPQFETKIFIKHPECEKNIVILFLQE